MYNLTELVEIVKYSLFNIPKKQEGSIDLIIKPTGKCNFACTFCSSHLYSLGNDKLPVSTIRKYLLDYNVNSIIVNGGEPLMMDPKYYFDILKDIRRFSPNTQISITTNLWDYCENPQKWKELFMQKEVGVITSFQPDGTRIIKDRGEPFTKEMFSFWLQEFKQEIGYMPHFITVASRDNLDGCIDAIKLAKDLGTICKVIPLDNAGRSRDLLTTGELFKFYERVYEEGLSKYEENTSLIVGGRLLGACPFLHGKCYKHIIALDPDGEEYKCGAMADKMRQLTKDAYVVPLKQECTTCRYFNYCNGCANTVFSMATKYTIIDSEDKTISFSNHTNLNCKSMKSLTTLNQFL